MTRRRFIADEVHGTAAAITGEHAHHLVRVLRVEAGQEFHLIAGAKTMSARITSVSPERVDFALLADLPPAEESLALHFFLSIYKFDRFEWALEKLTELGVRSVTPVVTRRTDLHLAKAAGNRVERWRKIAREAAQQSRRDNELTIAEPLKLKQIVETEGQRLVLSEIHPAQGTIVSLPDFLRDANDESLLNIAVGPEGGWAEEELELLSASAWQPVTLGPRILRAETAAIVAAAIVLAHL